MIDDFFIMADTEEKCHAHLQAFLNICKDLGVPMAPEKNTTPATNTTFLGIELDTLNQRAKLPIDKLLQYKAVVGDTLQKHRISRKELESLVGKLSFAASVVPARPARPFLRRTTDLTYSVSKPFYNVRITNEVRKDLELWKTLLSQYNGITYFRYQQLINSDTIRLSSDACKSGFGACYGSKWIQGTYPNSWQQLHITILELFPIYLLMKIFGHLMSNSNILFLCDNKAVTDIVNKHSSKDKTVMNIIRPLVMEAIQHHIMLLAKHISGKSNILPDRISRFQVTDGLLRQYNMEVTSTNIPQDLLPENFTIKWISILD